MGLPEPIEPRSGGDESGGGDVGRADWLCGPEEGLEAERRWRESHATPAPKLVRPGAVEPDLEPRAEAPALPAPRLVRPSSPDAPDPHPTPASAVPSPKLSRPAGAGAEATGEATPDDPAPEPAVLWQPAGNSVPSLSLDPVLPTPPAPSLPAPAADLDFPMDDAEERSLARAAAAAAEAAAASAPASAEPGAGPAAVQPHAVVRPEAFDIHDAPAPWWMQVPQLLREDRRVQGLLALLVVVLLAVAFWPRPEKSLAIGAIRRDALHYDGQQVRISGRVGEVFEVGGGHTFYLHQGRDTIVVFTRSRTPRRGEKTIVNGMVSTGFFNGQSGTAVFESTAP